MICAKLVYLGISVLGTGMRGSTLIFLFNFVGGWRCVRDALGGQGTVKKWILNVWPFSQGCVKHLCIVIFDAVTTRSFEFYYELVFSFPSFFCW